MSTLTRVGPSGDRVYKCVFFGPQGVGKSSVLYKLSGVGAEYGSLPPTTLFNRVSFDLMGPNGKATFDCWEASAEPSLRVQAASFLKRADFAVLVFSLADPNSLASLLRDWVPLVTENFGGGKPILFLGTCFDIPHPINVDNFRAALRGCQADCLFIEDVQLLNTEGVIVPIFPYVFSEVSAVTGVNLSESFYKMILMIQKSEQAKLIAKSHLYLGKGHTAVANFGESVALETEEQLQPCCKLWPV